MAFRRVSRHGAVADRIPTKLGRWCLRMVMMGLASFMSDHAISLRPLRGDRRSLYDNGVAYDDHAREPGEFVEPVVGN